MTVEAPQPDLRVCDPIAVHVLADLGSAEAMDKEVDEARCPVDKEVWSDRGEARWNAHITSGSVGLTLCFTCGPGWRGPSQVTSTLPASPQVYRLAIGARAVTGRIRQVHALVRQHAPICHV